VDNPNDFFDWLAVQPPFVEVALGAFFCLIVAPALLAGVAMAVTALEALAETQLTPLFAFRRAGTVSHSTQDPRPAFQSDVGVL
jgi:hypothetical protein